MESSAGCVGRCITSKLRQQHVKMSISGTASNNTVFPFGQPIVWHPPADTSDLNLVRFMKRHGIDDYPSLYRRSIEDVAWFWDAALKDLGIEFRTPYESIVDLSNGIDRKSTRLNYSHV